jgi:hypothetical protein
MASGINQTRVTHQCQGMADCQISLKLLVVSVKSSINNENALPVSRRWSVSYLEVRHEGLREVVGLCVHRLRLRTQLLHLPVRIASSNTREENCFQQNIVINIIMVVDTSGNSKPSFSMGAGRLI